jgi:hypothetical protein
MAKRSKLAEADRGRIEEIKLKKSITINGHLITHAVIEIDHINHGLNEKTGKLNTIKRSSFSIRDIEQFLKMLDGEFLYADHYKGKIAKYSIRIDCPLPGKNHKKTYLMFFNIDFGKPETIFTLTLYPG